MQDRNENRKRPSSLTQEDRLKHNNKREYKTIESDLKRKLKTVNFFSYPIEFAIENC